MVQNVEGLNWVSYRNVTSAQFSANFAAYNEAGYIMVDVEAYPMAGGLRYAAAWVDNTQGLAWIERRDLTSEQFSEYFSLYQDEYRVLDIESYQRNGEQNYAAIWVENDNNRGKLVQRDLTAQAYSNYWNLYRDLGYRLIDYEVYPYGNGYRYAGVWRQNSSLPNWSLKNDVNALVEAQLNEFNVPGIGVAIIEGGEMRYHRGFGFADIDDNVWYSSRTRNPLASVSKPIGAVLTMQLVEDGVIDLDDLTGSHVASMPNHQTHTLQELLSMRGGVGHYDNHG